MPICGNFNYSCLTNRMYIVAMKVFLMNIFRNMPGEKEQSIATFCFFDTETTGLPSPGNNPRITELSLVALGKEELLTKGEPRVVNKLTLCFNPRKRINPYSSQITGIWHFWLHHLDLTEWSTIYNKKVLSSAVWDIRLIFDDRLREKFLKSWKGVLYIHFRVCLCVC